MEFQHFRFIHCADLHLDSCMESHLSRFQAQNRRKELIQSFLRMTEYATQNTVHVILISGDLFDTAHPSSSAVKAVLECMRNHPQIDFLYLPGNHDYTSLTAPSIEISWPSNFCLLQSKKEAHETKTTACKVSEKEASLQNLPHFSQNSLRSAHTLMQKHYGNITITGLSGDISELVALSPDQFNLVMLHGQIEQYGTSGNNESASNGCYHYYINDLANRNIDYIAAGHIHQYQSAAIDNRGIYCYSGCLEGRGFDECGEKGFILLDIIPHSPVKSSKINFRFVPFSVRRFYDFDVDVTDSTDYSSIEDKVHSVLSTIDSPHLVRLKLTGRVSPELNLHPDWLMLKYSVDFYFLRIEDHTKSAISYEDYRYDISLKGEFIRLVLLDSSLKDEDKEKIIMEGLHALAGEEIVPDYETDPLQHR